MWGGEGQKEREGEWGGGQHGRETSDNNRRGKVWPPGSGSDAFKSGRKRARLVPQSAGPRQRDGNERNLRLNLPFLTQNTQKRIYFFSF